jgi:hypothetical protein
MRGFNRSRSLFSVEYCNLTYALVEAVRSGIDVEIVESARQLAAYYDSVRAASNGRCNQPTDREAAKLLADAVNSMSFDHQGFFEELRAEHRTIQQSVMRCMVGYIRLVSEIPDNEMDGRNRASVELARSIMLAEGNGVINLGLPLI